MTSLKVSGLIRHPSCRTLTAGAEFRNRAKKYLIAGLERGVPSLFVDVKGLYTDADKLAIVGEIVEETVSNLEKDVSLHGDGELTRALSATAHDRLGRPSHRPSLGILLPRPPPFAPIPPQPISRPFTRASREGKPTYPHPPRNLHGQGARPQASGRPPGRSADDGRS